MANIRVTPEELAAQGKELISLADNEITQLLQTIDSKVNAICDSWDGMAQDAFLQSYEAMKEMLKQFPAVVQGIGSQAEAAAQAFGSVDEELSNSMKAN